MEERSLNLKVEDLVLMSQATIEEAEALREGAREDELQELRANRLEQKQRGILSKHVNLPTSIKHTKAPIRK